MKKIGLLVVCLSLMTSVGFASPLMDYSQGKAALDVTYRAYKDMDVTAYDKYYNSNGGSENESYSQNIDGKNDFEWGITLGLGNDYALQYRGLNAKAEGTVDQGGSGESAKTTQDNRYFNETVISPKIRSQEVNVLRKLNNNFSAFAGLVRVNASVEARNHRGDIANNDNGWQRYEKEYLGTEEKNIGQIGIIGNAKIADKTNLYGIASIGNDYRNWEAGLSYEIGKNTEFNVSYRSAKYDDIKVASGNSSSTQQPRIMSATYSESWENSADVKTKGWGFGFTYKF